MDLVWVRHLGGPDPFGDHIELTTRQKALQLSGITKSGRVVNGYDEYLQGPQSKIDAFMKAIKRVSKEKNV
jgi:hypothetical protein